jgi:hypothetical protein
MADIFTTVRVYRAIGAPYQTDEDVTKNVWSLNVYTSADDGVTFFEKPFKFEDKNFAESFSEHLGNLTTLLKESITEANEELTRLEKMLESGLPYIEMVELDSEDNDIDEDEVILDDTLKSRMAKTTSNMVH